MKIIISPAKTMVENTDTYQVEQEPIYIEETEKILDVIKKLTYSEAKAVWKCNDKLAELNYGRFQQMDLHKRLTPAILAYEGLQYQHMAPIVFADEAVDYVREHLRILSGFYGVVSPFDGVALYRLEMQANLPVDGKKNLYEFWGDKLYHEIRDEDGVIINLASKEYSKTIEKYLDPQDRFITVVFGQISNGKVKQSATFAKMARGEMVRFMAENQITDVEEIKAFSELGFSYSDEYSKEDQWVFVRQAE